MQAIDTRWFTDTLRARKLSQRGLGRLLDCNASSINRLINGKRPLRFEEAELLADHLGVEVAEIISHAGVSVEPTGATTYLVGYIDGQHEAHIDWDTRAQPVDAPTALPPGAVAVQYRTADTPLESLDGWTVYVEPPTERIEHAVNRLALIALDTGATTVGLLRRGYQPGRYNVRNINSREHEEVGVRWATPVLLLQP